MSLRVAGRMVALPVVAVLSFPVGAHAETVVTQDLASDVVSFAGKSADSEQTPAPDYAGVDIVRTAVDHGTHRLRVSVGFRALERDPFQLTGVRISTPQGNYHVTIERLGGKPIISLERGGKSIDCRGLRATVDMRVDRMTTSLPTSCLGTPRWVQVGVGAVAVAANQTSPEQAAAYADDAHREGGIGETIAKGPKVRRG